MFYILKSKRASVYEIKIKLSSVADALIIPSAITLFKLK